MDLALPQLLLLQLPVPNVEQVIQLYDQIKVYRCDTGPAGTYAEITNVDTRIRLERSLTVYSIHDTTGTVTSWYKTSYFNSKSSVETALSGPRQAYDDRRDANILTVQQLKDIYLFGVNLTDDNAVPYPDSVFELGIRAAIDHVEREVGINIRKTVVTHERYDYYRRDYQEWVTLQLRKTPVISVEAMRVMWPSDTLVMTFDPSWLRLRPSGQLNVVPMAGTLSQVLLTVGGSFLPFIAVGRDWVPDIFDIDYTCGFEEGQVPPLVRDAVGMYASFAPLNLAGDLIAGAGIASQSLSMDGLSQSISTTSSATNAGYGARLVQYRQQLRDLIPQLRRTYQGIGFVAL